MVGLAVVGEVFLLDPFQRGIEGARVQLSGPLIIPQGEVDVRGHVQGMHRGGRNFGVNVRGAQTQRRMHGVVVAVNIVMQHAGVSRRPVHQCLGNGAGLHELIEIPPVMAGSQYRQGIQRTGIHVLRPGLADRFQRRAVGVIPFPAIPFTKQDVHRTDIRFFAFSLRFVHPFPGSRRQLFQHGPGRGQVLLVPQRMFMGQRLTPVGHDKVRVHLPRLPERLPGILVFKIMQHHQAADKHGMRPRVATGMKIRRAVLLRVGRSGENRCEDCQQYQVL